MKKLLILISLLLFFSCEQNKPMFNYEFLGFNKKVSKVTESYFETEQKFGEWAKGDLSSKNIFYFDDYGNQIKVDRYNNKGDLDSRTIYKYSVNKIERSHYNSNGDFTRGQSFVRRSHNSYYYQNNDSNDSNKQFSPDGFFVYSKVKWEGFYTLIEEPLITFDWVLEDNREYERTFPTHGIDIESSFTKEYLNINKFGDWEKALWNYGSDSNTLIFRELIYSEN